MKRYDMSYDPDYREDCIVEMDNGDYVLHSEAQAEIARLQSELSEAKESLRLAVKSAYLADAAIATARTDALEEAAELARKLSCKSAAAAIRAMIDKDQPK